MTEENDRLRHRLKEAEDTLEAIRTGQVDALIVRGDDGEKVYILEGADRPYRVFFDQMSEGAATLSRDGTIIFTNRSLLDTLGLAKDVVGHRIEELVDKTSRPTMDALMKKARASAAQGDVDLVAAGGAPVPARLSLNSLGIGGDEFICMTVTDLRERKRHEKAMEQAQLELESKVRDRTKELEKTRQRLETVINQMPVGVAVADVETGTLPQINREWENIFRRSIPGERRIDDYDIWRNAFHADGRPYEENEVPLFRALHGELVQNEEMRVLRGDGTWGIVDASAVPINDDEGRTVAAVVVETDMTETRRLEKELQDHAKKLARSNAELEQFAFVASHDLREPLRMVSIHLGLLEKRYKGKVLDEKAHEYIRFAIDGSRRMDDLVNDLLEFSRVGTRKAPMEPTDMQAVLDQTLATLKMRIVETGATVTQGRMPTIIADRAQMMQLMQNLIDNALKFHGSVSPQVSVSATRADGGWVFSVKDNGIGIEPKHQEKVFELFARLHTREEFEGTGIGLAVCRKIVERHGGKIWVESEPGKGSTFYFSIPSEPADAAGVASAQVR